MGVLLTSYEPRFLLCRTYLAFHLSSYREHTREDTWHIAWYIISPDAHTMVVSSLSHGFGADKNEIMYINHYNWGSSHTSCSAVTSSLCVHRAVGSRAVS